jgi:hypothetical protein
MTEWSASSSGRLPPGERAAAWEPGVNRLGRKEYGRDFEADTAEELAIALILQKLSLLAAHSASQVQSDNCVTTGCVRLLTGTSTPELLRNASNFPTSTVVTILLSAWTHELYTHCGRHGVVVVRPTSERPGNVIPLSETFGLFII